jgi:hypothetical protein
MSQELGLEELQEKARTGTLAEFKQLLEDYGAVQGVTKQGAPVGISGRDYLEQALETGTVSARKGKLQALKKFDIQNNIKDPDVDAALAEEAQNEAQNEDVSGTVQKAAQEALEAINGLKEYFNGELAKRDTAIAELTTANSELAATVDDLTTKLNKTEALAIAGAKRAGELTPRVDALDASVNALKNPGLYKSFKPQ